MLLLGTAEFLLLRRPLVSTRIQTGTLGASTPSVGEALSAERLNEITERIIGSSILVHRATGPGLLESVYLAFHQAQMLTYLRLAGYAVGLVNFNTKLLIDGVRRVVNGFPEPAGDVMPLPRPRPRVE
jgi:hypothetical protein